MHMPHQATTTINALVTTTTEDLLDLDSDYSDESYTQLFTELHSIKVPEDHQRGAYFQK
jgi:hypothetical protein